jgi:ribokinase
MIGELGEDSFADVLVESLQASGVDHTGVGRSPGSTGTACILVLPSGENLIVVSPAANARLSVEKLQSRWSGVDQHSILLCQLEVPMDTTAWALATAHTLRAVTILDPAPAQTLGRDLLSAVSYLTPNQTEAALLLGGGEIHTISDASDAARKLLEFGPANVIVKLGSLGCVIANRSECIHIAGFSVTPVDTTAAGDTFNAAFAVALAEGAPAQAAARFAHAAAAISVTRFGAQSSIPTRAEVDAFLTSH